MPCILLLAGTWLGSAAACSCPQPAAHLTRLNTPPLTPSPQALFPIMYEMTSSRGQDVFEEVMDMASYFTYFMTPIRWVLKGGRPPVCAFTLRYRGRKASLRAARGALRRPCKAAACQVLPC